MRITITGEKDLGQKYIHVPVVPRMKAAPLTDDTVVLPYKRPDYTLVFERRGNTFEFKEVIRQMVTYGFAGEILDIAEEP